MVHKLFTVYDSKAEVYLTPFFMKSRGEALRAWSDIVNDSQSMFFRHGGDYTLFEVGEYDDATGKVVSHQSYINLGLALDFQRKKEGEVLDAVQ